VIGYEKYKINIKINQITNIHYEQNTNKTKLATSLKSIEKYSQISLPKMINNIKETSSQPICIWSQIIDTFYKNYHPKLYQY
jgi:hypothetical protein